MMMCIISLFPFHVFDLLDRIGFLFFLNIVSSNEKILFERKLSNNMLPSHSLAYQGNNLTKTPFI
jgi:hypothetical protein